jgi:hypothetical protein
VVTDVVTVTRQDGLLVRFCVTGTGITRWDVLGIYEANERINI